MMIKTGVLVVALAVSAQTAAAQERHTHDREIPKSMRDEHEEVMWGLQDAMKSPGAVGEAARALEVVLRPHFVREEAIALPPLGVLRRLVEIQDVAQMAHWILPVTDSLRAELPHMLEEHKTIRGKVQELERTAQAAGNQNVLKFTAELKRHAESEEEMFYPMAVLVGEIVRARMKQHAH